MARPEYIVNIHRLVAEDAHAGSELGFANLKGVVNVCFLARY